LGQTGSVGFGLPTFIEKNYSDRCNLNLKTKHVSLMQVITIVKDYIYIWYLSCLIYHCQFNLVGSGILFTKMKYNI